MFDNPTTVGDPGTGNVNYGKYFIDRNSDGVKNGTCTTSTTDECYVDTWNNYAEGNLKGKYTALSDADKLLVKPQVQKPVNFSALYSFTDATTFKKKVDNSMAGQMRDCGECHVGGGAFEYVPVAQGTTLAPGVRPELRANPAIVTTGVNTYNYFIDQYDDNGNGVLGEVLPQNYADTGVLEMDCLVCHMAGYSWDKRTEAIRKGNFDASRVAGAGLGVADNADGSLNLNGAGAGTGYGKKVTYDALMVANNAGNATLGPLALNAIQAKPESANCSACHMDLHKVDWKKRGDTWAENMAYQTEVHKSIGCIGCHTRDDGKEMDPNNALAGTGDNPDWTGNATNTAAATTLGHDPSKGDAPYSSLWNNTDNTVRTCAGCHTKAAGKTYYGFGGAPDPTNKHDFMGLTSTLIQTGGMGKMTGVADGNHLDVITCEACHTRKLGHGPAATESLYEWGTGGALVDSTGADAEGRLTDHENLYVERTMENNLTVAWQGNKISTRNALLSMFWVDKDEEFGTGNKGTYIDINADGQDGGMDAVNASHVRNAMKAAALNVLTHDGVITGTEIAAQKTALQNYLPTVGVDYLGRTPKLKLALMGVFFKVNHGTTPAANAWGAGGCKDCHGANKGFYNGPYDQKPRDLQASWTNTGATDWSAVEGGKPGWNYVVPFTTVNMDNYSGRDVNLPLCSTYYGPNPRPAPPTMGTTLQIGQACSEGGTSGTWTLYALGKIKADYQFSDYHPTTWAKGQPGRSIAITSASGASDTIRVMDRSEGLWEASFVTGTYNGTIKGTNGVNYTTRTAWVSYLNGLDNYRPAVHKEHASYDCSVCHSDGVAPVGGRNANYSLVSDPQLPAAQQFTFTIRPDTGTATCATACHNVALATLPTDVATARISTQHAIDTNFKVNLDGSKSACYHVDPVTGVTTAGSTHYTWSFDSVAPSVAPTSNTCGSELATCNATWAAAGTNNVTLAVTCSAGGATNSKTIGVTGFDVGAGVNAAPGFAISAPVAKLVTLTQATLDANVADVQILWGDNTKTTINNKTPATVPTLDVFKTSGVAHTYAASGTYSVSVVTTNDGTPNNKMYPYTFTVVIP